MLKFFARCLDDILLVLGIAFISTGAFIISIPGGFVVSGLCFIGLGILVARRRVIFKDVAR